MGKLKKKYNNKQHYATATAFLPCSASTTCVSLNYYNTQSDKKKSFHDKNIMYGI